MTNGNMIIHDRTKVLITGASGLLGRYLMHTVDEDTYEVFPFRKYGVTTDMPSLDISNFAWVDYVFDSIRPEYVIHCAAIGSPDYCEQHYREAHKVNVLGMLNVMQATKRHNAKLVYISSNAVYDGDNPPYSENSPMRPVNLYGLMKKQAEELVLYYDKHLIIRPSLFYGWPGKDGRDNVATMAIREMSQGRQFFAVDDIYVQPVFVHDMANFIWKCMYMDGVINVGSSVSMSIYEFIQKFAKVFDLNLALILKSESSKLKRNIAKRPKKAVFSLDVLNELDMCKIDDVDSGLIRMKENVI